MALRDSPSVGAQTNRLLGQMLETVRKRKWEIREMKNLRRLATNLIVATFLAGCANYDEPPATTNQSDGGQPQSGDESVCAQFLARLQTQGYADGCGPHLKCAVYHNGGAHDGSAYCGSDPANPRLPGSSGACGEPGLIVDACYCQGTWERHDLVCLNNHTIALCPCTPGPAPDYGCGNNQPNAINCASVGWAEYVADGCSVCKSFAFNTGTCQPFNTVAGYPCPNGQCDGKGNCVP